MLIDPHFVHSQSPLIIMLANDTVTVQVEYSGCDLCP